MLISFRLFVEFFAFKVEPRFRFFWSWGDLKKALPMEFVGDDLWETLARTPLAPGQAVEGWELFAPPEEYNYAPQPAKFQIQVRDVEGARCSMESDGPPDNQQSKIANTSGVQVTTQPNQPYCL
jgi:hypothetical protein